MTTCSELREMGTVAIVGAGPDGATLARPSTAREIRACLKVGRFAYGIDLGVDLDVAA